MITGVSDDPAFQSTFNGMFLPADILPVLDILVDGVEHTLCHGANTGVTVTGSTAQKGHVIGIEM